MGAQACQGGGGSQRAGGREGAGSGRSGRGVADLLVDSAAERGCGLEHEDGRGEEDDGEGEQVPEVRLEFGQELVGGASVWWREKAMCES